MKPTAKELRAFQQFLTDGNMIQFAKNLKKATRPGAAMRGMRIAAWYIKNNYGSN